MVHDHGRAPAGAPEVDGSDGSRADAVAGGTELLSKYRSPLDGGNEVTAVASAYDGARASNRVACGCAGGAVTIRILSRGCPSLLDCRCEVRGGDSRFDRMLE
jgi:hypothetical protein